MYFFIYRKSIEIIRNTLKIEEKFSNVKKKKKKIRVGPINVELVGFQKQDFFFGLTAKPLKQVFS